MKRAAVVAVVLAACETPDTKIVYAISDGDAQSCGSTSCADVKIPCDAVVSIRILSPADPAAPYVSICEPLPPNRNRDLCAISSIDLADAPLELPKQALEVQILIWKREDILNEVTGELDCGKYEVDFDAVGGFPIARQPSPAIGGHTYYHPGDDEARVTLGCTDLPSLNKCTIDPLEVSVTVESFENLGVSVSVNQASRFKVDVGEPSLDGAGSVFSLNPADTRSLALTIVNQVIPIWRGNVDLMFTDVACAQVLEDSAQATAAVSCTQDNVMASTLELGGVQFPKPTLDQVLAALGMVSFPPNGMTVGIVLDPLFNPTAGQTVTAPGATIRYLSADRTTVGGSATSASGIFVSTDAPFGTKFTVPGSPEEIGGQIQGKVTVVVLQK